MTTPTRIVPPADHRGEPVAVEPDGTKRPLTPAEYDLYDAALDQPRRTGAATEKAMKESKL